MQIHQQEKPRLKYHEYVAQQAQPITVGQIMERYIVEMNGSDGKPPVKPVLLSQFYTMKLVARYPIGAIAARALTKADVKAHCNLRLSEGVKPQTVMQDITYLTVALKYAGSEWDDCEGISDTAVKAAKPSLTKHNLICKSAPRDRLPQDEEIARLLAHFAEENKRPRNAIDMVAVTLWQIRSGRRISETCRIVWEEWDREAHTIVVHKMKDARNRNKTKKVALPDEAQAMLEEMYERRDPDEPRIFPYVAKSCVARYVVAKNALGIVGLRLHDSRAKCYTSMREKGIPSAIAILVTGHERDALPERVYKRMTADSFKDLQHVREAA